MTSDLASGIYLGTSGWSYPEWKGIIYPENLPQNRMFGYYSRFFHSAEINSTFYQIPSKKTAENWSKKCPDGFKYSAKIPELVTHKAKLDLDDSIGPLNDFLSNMDPLFQNNQVISLLLQLPPSFGNNKEQDFATLKKFGEYWNSKVIDQFENYTKIPPQLTVEFRNKYWMMDKTFDLLKELNLTYCAVIEPLLPPRFDITTDSLFYIRFHGFGTKPWFNYNFTEDQLNQFSKNLDPILNFIKERKERKAVLYFNNHFSGYAVKNALYLAKQLNIAVKGNQEDLLKSEKELNRNKGPQKSLDAFF